MLTEIENSQTQLALGPEQGTHWSYLDMPCRYELYLVSSQGRAPGPWCHSQWIARGDASLDQRGVQKLTCEPLRIKIPNVAREGSEVRGNAADALPTFFIHD
jgi:hypothetical protein